MLKLPVVIVIITLFPSVALSSQNLKKLFPNRQNLSSKQAAAVKGELMSELAIKKGIKSFPPPIAEEDHPLFDLQQGKVSVLERHWLSIKIFKEKVLPLIVRRNIKNKELKLAVIGPATGEEMATMLAAIIQVFDKHPEWGRVDEWQIKVEGIEINTELVEEASKRLKGESPFTKFTSATVDFEKYPNYDQRVSATLSSLNEHLEWAVGSFELSIGNAAEIKNYKYNLDEYDVMIMHATFYGMSSSDSDQFAKILESKASNTFFIGTGDLLQHVHSPIDSIEGRFVVKSQYFSSSSLPYRTVIPAWAQPLWKNPWDDSISTVYLRAS